MDSDPKSALGLLNHGIQRFDDGDLAGARDLFAQALREEPENEVAWLWLAEASDDLGEKRYCLDRAVAINPDSAGLPKREALRTARVEPAVPAAIRDLAKPGLPPSLQTAKPATASSFRKKLPWRRSSDKASGPAATPLRRPWVWVALATAAALLLVGAWYAFLRSDEPALDAIHFAVVAPLTGENASIGREVRNAAMIAQDDINSSISVGPKVELVFFDDQNDPDLAVEVAKQIVADDRIVGVVGHGTSGTSMAAAPIYAAADMPVITGQATIDALSDFPNYFRTIYANSDEARILTQYLQVDLGQDRASIVKGTSAFEESLGAAFENKFGQQGTISHVWTIGEDQKASIASIVEEMQEADDVGTLFLALTEDNAYEMILQLRRAGLDPLIVGSETIGTQGFAQRFAFFTEEQSEPGFFTHNLVAVSPLLYDSVGGATLSFANNYKEEYKKTPGWRAAKTWDALNALALAAQRGLNVPEGSELPDLRPTIIRELGKMTDPATGFQGLAGPVYFTEGGRSPQGLSLGIFDERMLISAPVQYRIIDNETNYDIEAELAAGSVIELDGYYVRRYRVVYVGVEMIELRDLSTSSQSYTADFYIYFRYNGDDAPLNIMFTNSADSALGLGEPLSESVTASGMNYRLFRVQGTFNEPMDFSDYPWDQHQLTIRFQNPDSTQNDIVYVADPAATAMTQEERLRSSFDLSRPFNRVPSWIVHDLEFEQVSIASTADAYDTEGIVYYSELRVLMNTGREVSSFLAKNLLPLALLTLVTYIAIWFPAEQAGARVGFAITALLSSSVMLNAISSQLPDIGYNVAIEWGYYAYIALSAVLVLLTIAVDRAYKAKRRGRVRRLDGFIRLMYPLTIAAVVGLYYLVYREGERLSGGQDNIRTGVVIILGIVLALSALVVFWPDHFDLRTLKGYNDPDLDKLVDPGAEAAS